MPFTSLTLSSWSILTSSDVSAMMRGLLLITNKQYTIVYALWYAFSYDLSKDAKMSPSFGGYKARRSNNRLCLSMTFIRSVGKPVQLCGARLLKRVPKKEVATFAIYFSSTTFSVAWATFWSVELFVILRQKILHMFVAKSSSKVAFATRTTRLLSKVGRLEATFDRK